MSVKHWERFVASVFEKSDFRFLSPTEERLPVVMRSSYLACVARMC
jgi:hypothetical protein